MPDNAFREYTPVVYSEGGVKVIHHHTVPKNSTAFPLHWHRRMEILNVTSGNMECTVDDKRFTVSKGETAIIDPYRPHGATAGENGVSYDTVMFEIKDFYNKSIASKLYLTAISDGIVKFTHHSNDTQIINAVKNIVKSDLENNRAAAVMQVSNVYALISLLLEKCITSDNSYRIADSRFKEVFTYIEEHLTENLSSKMLSETFGYNEAYFCRKFKEIAGINTMKYILILRLETAAEMLKDDTSISDVSNKCAFCSTSHFSNCFKKHFGISPTEYKCLNGK